MTLFHFRRTWLLVASLFVGILAIQAQEQAKRPAIPVKDWKDATAFPVSRIIDGDTVEIQDEGKTVKVRLIGVDTPETVHPSKPVEAFGKEASQFTTSLLKGQSVYLEYDQEKVDKYGRRLAYLYRAPDGLFVNLEIVRQGYGHAYTKYPFKHMEMFRSCEKEAREAARGLWVANSVAPQVLQEISKDVEPATKDITVYRTKSGGKYHAAGCRYLSKNSIPISLDLAKKSYSACSVCKPPQ